jgi:hypothetical protein
LTEAGQKHNFPFLPEGGADIGFDEKKVEKGVDGGDAKA